MPAKPLCRLTPSTTAAAPGTTKSWTELSTFNLAAVTWLYPPILQNVEYVVKLEEFSFSHIKFRCCWKPQFDTTFYAPIAKSFTWWYIQASVLTSWITSFGWHTKNDQISMIITTHQRNPISFTVYGIKCMILVAYYYKKATWLH